ncbi:major intrinsic protein, partial [Nannochloropsis gaditana CCMP526]
RDPASGGVVDIIMPRTSSAPHQVEDESKQPLMPAQDNKVKDNVIESQAMSEEETASAGHSNAERNKSHLSEEHGDKKVSEGHRKHRRYLTAGAQCCSQTFTILQNLLAVPMTEALGTLTLTLVVGLLSRPAAGVDSLTAAIGVAAVLLAMINTGAPISGAHYNPAVTFALLLIGRVSPFRALVYIASQTVGAIGGAYLARGLAASDQLADPFLPEGVTGELALVEISFTYALVMVVIHTAFARAQQPNAYAGVAICATLVTGASLGAVMNPAVSAG